MKRIFSILFALVLAVSLMLVPAASVEASPGPGLVGQWHLDGDANDSSGNDNHGTVYGATYVSGKFGQALSFDGNDYVDCGAAVDNSIAAGVTLEAWIKPAVKQRGGIISNHVTFYPPHKGYDFFLWDDDKFGVHGSLFIDFGNGSSSSLGRTWWSIPSLDWYGHWHHVAATWDGSNIKLYVDGSQVSTLTYSGSYSDPGKSTFIGAINHGLPIWHFNGEIDEVRIWDEVVNPVTVSLRAGQHMDAGTVTVWNDSTNLHVEYQTTGGWCLTETHLHVATSLGAIPQRNGNPVPGQFDYPMEHDCATAHTYTIPLDEEWEPCETELVIAAHAVVIAPIDDCYETVWQIGDVETVNATAGWLENYADEFNWGDPAGPTTMGPSLAVEQPSYTNPFVVGTTPTDEFPFNSNSDRDYATDFDVQWSGELPFGGMLTISWSPGASATETKVVSGDGITSKPISATGVPRPGEGWFLDTYPLVENSVAVGPLPDGTHSINFEHTKGNGTYWDWVLLEKPCEQEETAWGDGEDFSGKNWATYFMYHVQ